MIDKRLAATGVAALTLFIGFLGITASPASAQDRHDANVEEVCPAYISSKILGANMGGATIAYGNQRTGSSSYNGALTDIWNCSYTPSRVEDCPSSGNCRQAPIRSWVRLVEWDPYASKIVSIR
jgi:hypothetical protein